jgi:flagellar biosynthesis/type III secretory pathway protein FliH
MQRARYDYYNDPFYYTAPNYRYRRNDRYYRTNQYGIRQLEKALQAGYNEGFRAGRADRQDRWRYDFRSAFVHDANYGYDGRYIDQNEYNHYFREGFQRGYDDGYYDRQKYGRKKDDGNVIEGVNDEWLIAGGVIAAIIGYQLLTD